MTDKFNGEKCIVCGEIFGSDDDIVVCPDCGTPYHRSCWKENGHCINNVLHETGQSWIPEGMQQEVTENDLRCVRCGTLNQPGEMFCGECGMPLKQNRNDERPFNNVNAAPNFGTGYNGTQDGMNNFSGVNQNADFGGNADDFNFRPQVRQIKLTEDSYLDGIKLGDFFDYVGRKSLAVIASFVKFAKTGAKTSFNVAALLFPEFYFFYRKMNKKGALFLLVMFLMTIPSLIYYGQSGDFGMVFFTTSINMKSAAFSAVADVCSFVTTAVRIFAALYANYWYYSKAREDISAIRSDENVEEPDAKAQISRAGGTSWAGVIGAFVGEMILTLGFMLIMTAIF